MKPLGKTRRKEIRKKGRNGFVWNKRERKILMLGIEWTRDIHSSSKLFFDVSIALYAEKKE